ncbi:HD domain-containing protein [Candidatus Sumerlaeota bacterium]|nr:HD domain-containing protein [Candidatus Sumerlaeota bacterium]
MESDEKHTISNPKLFRDPLHGLIEFERGDDYGRLLLRLIDSPEFQRLRRIRQLGLAWFAYHGAEHTRFTHSLGVAHVAQRIITHLRRGYEITDDQEFLVRCTALLHDIGHGPFSHVLEPLFGGRHEAWSARIVLEPQSRVNQLLAEFDIVLPAMIVDTLEHHVQPRFLAHLIASQLDADRFDYLLRDSHMTGVKYGVFDLDRLIAMLEIGRDKEQLIVSRRGIWTVEQYLLSRHQMFRQVYQHKTVIAAENMLRALLQRAQTLAREKRLDCVERDSCMHRLLAAESADDIALTDFLELDDYSLWHYVKGWRASRDAILSDLSRRLLARDLFKSITLELNEQENLEERLDAAREILRAAGCDPEYYLLLREARDTPYKPYDPASGKPATSVFIENPSSTNGYSDIAQLSSIVQGLMRQTPRTLHLNFPAEFNEQSLRDKIAAALKSS